MPNWVRNKIEIIGPNYKDVIKKTTTYNEKEDCIDFDFNKIVQMPESIRDIIAGSVTTEAMELFITSIKNTPEFRKYLSVIISNGGNYSTLSDEDYKKKMNNVLTEIDLMGNKYFKTEEDVLLYGKKAFDNQIEYGCIDWYEWSIKNWNVKWNASETYIEDNVISFETPWDAVSNLIIKMSTMFPENTFHYSFSEEQICVFCGDLEVKNGQVLEENIYEPESKESFEKGFEFWPDVKRFYKFNNKTNTYEFCEDEMD